MKIVKADTYFITFSLITQQVQYKLGEENGAAVYFYSLPGRGAGWISPDDLGRGPLTITPSEML